MGHLPKSTRHFWFLVVDFDISNNFGKLEEEKNYLWFFP